VVRGATTPSRTTDAAQLCGPAGQPAARPAARHAGTQPRQRCRRLDPHPGHIAVEQHGVVDDGLAVQQLRVAARPPFGCPDDRGPGLVADQRYPLRRPAPRPAGRPTAGR